MELIIRKKLNDQRHMFFCSIKSRKPLLQLRISAKVCKTSCQGQVLCSVIRLKINILILKILDKQNILVYTLAVKII